MQNITGEEFVQGVIEAQLEIAQKLIVSSDRDEQRKGRALRELFEPMFRFVVEESRREKTKVDAAGAMVYAAAELNRIALNLMAQSLLAFDLEDLAAETKQAFNAWFERSIQVHAGQRNMARILPLGELLEAMKKRAAEYQA